MTAAPKLHRFHLMDLRIFVEPQQGASYDDQLAIARESETLGFDAFFRSDHYLRIGEGSGAPGPTDAWITLAGLARETSTIRLGTMVTPATFRLPGPLAISVAEVDAMSGGRVELGLGGGWYDGEHAAYGIPFPALGARLEQLEEQLAIITGLWATPEGSTFSHAGAHYQVTDSPALPKPVQRPGPPVIIGGWGSTRTPRLAATYAAEFNVPFPPVDAFADQCDKVRAACDAVDRDPGSLVYSACVVICCGSDEAEVDRRAAAIGRTPADLREHAVAGSPDEVVANLQAFAASGAERIYLQCLDMTDLDHVRLIAETVLPHV
jgi:F420-dependent oxidoreductase-like protein